MPTTIDYENSKQIRKPMDIFVTFSSRQSGATLTDTQTGAKVADTNLSAALSADNWPMRSLYDFQGEGFPLDGSCVFLDATAASLEDGKIGLRSNIGGTMTVEVHSNVELSALTIALVDDTPGTITANGVTHAARRLVILPVNDTEITFVIESDDPDRRIQIASITAGLTMEFTRENLISCNLDLRSDLAMDDPSVEVSSIEVSAYWPDDITEVVGNCGDDTPITYYAGYEGDYSPIRSFYLSERASMENHIVTIKGEDASAWLDDKSTLAEVLLATSGTGQSALYNKFVSYIEEAGIVLTSKEAAPATEADSTACTLVTKASNCREVVTDIMNLAHVDDFWPTFVDAGIPTVYHTKPSKKWDIYEYDCGDVVRSVDKNIAKIETGEDETYGLHSTATRSNTVTTLETMSVTAGKGYSWESNDAYYWNLTVSNSKSLLATASKAVWTALKTTTTKSGKTYNQCIVKGKAVNLAKQDTVVVAPGARLGYTMQVSPLSMGSVKQGADVIYPNYNHLFDRSNITGSFTWKGDPRMQPRDVFAFHRLDGTVEDCTIESIELDHDAGGTQATISYRKGVC